MNYQPERLYLDVPFQSRDVAKECGARWCPEKRLWWIYRNEIGGNPAIYQWIMTNGPLRAKAKEGYEFLRLQADKLPGPRHPRA